MSGFLGKIKRVFKKNDEEKESVKKETAPAPDKEDLKVVPVTFASPMNGEIYPIEEVPDEAFAGKMMGDGFFVLPVDGNVLAPEDGEVQFVFETNHALGLKTQSGIEYLIHVGVDTVKLEGKGFKAFVENHSLVKQGDKLLEVDIDYVKSHAPSNACIVIFTSGETVKLTKTGRVQALEVCVELQAS